MGNAVELVGQKKLLGRLNSYIVANAFPRCSMLVGQKGSGKRTIAKYIANKLDAQCVISAGNIDDVRQIIHLAYKSHLKTVYVFVAESMSVNAENAVLKFLEEPPNNAYIIVTAQSTTNVLYTILSRCMVFSMDKYTPTEIFNYYWTVLSDGMPNDAEVVRAVCETPGDVNLMIDGGVTELYDYARLVVENIAEVSGANALKIGSRIAFKDADTDKFNLMLFFKAFKCICAEELDTIHAHWILITSKRMQELSIKGINKSMLFDIWVLQCRQAVITQ